MHVKIIRSWRNLVPGRILDVADGYGNTLVRRKIAVAVQDESGAVAVEASDVPGKRRKRP